MRGALSSYPSLLKSSLAAQEHLVTSLHDRRIVRIGR
jgi:hypothetical protein